MPNMALVPYAPTRPYLLPHEGGWVNVGLHDAFYRDRYLQLKRLVIDCHPDRRPVSRMTFMRYRFREVKPDNRAGGIKFPDSTGAFVRAQTKLAKFIAEESKWYAEFNLLPPFGAPAAKPAPPCLRCGCAECLADHQCRTCRKKMCQTCLRGGHGLGPHECRKRR